MSFSLAYVNEKFMGFDMIEIKKECDKMSIAETECINKSFTHSISIGQIEEMRKDDPYMTLIIARQTEDSFIIGADSCMNYVDGRKGRINKIIYDAKKKLIFACAGHSSVIHNGRSVKINDVIHHVLEHTGNYKELKELLFYDMKKFLPTDMDSFTDIMIARIEDEEILVEGYRASLINSQFSIQKCYDNHSYFDTGTVILGCVKSHSVLEVYESLHVPEKEKITQTIQHFVDAKEYPAVDGDVHLIVLKKDGTMQTFINGIEKEWQ